MTGPEHYREAERLAERSYHFTYGDGCDTATGAALASLANVHATLALATAAALLPFCDPDSGTEDFDLDAWRKTAGGQA
jgi:hypothetical protein